MVSEKTPALYVEKESMLYDDREKSRLCSKSVATWVFAAILLALVVVVSIQFLVPIVDKQVYHDVETVRIFQEEPLPSNRVPPVMTDYISAEQKAPKSKPWEIEFLTDPSALCVTRYPPHSEQYQQDPEVKLLMMVLSPASHFKERKVIRSTWGLIAENPYGTVRLGFVIGTATDETEEYLIKEESNTYRDIIQVNLPDSARQHTQKSVLMLKWVTRRCPHAQYFLKAEDDSFVNVGIVANILGKEPFVSQDKFIGGYIQKGIPPSRVPNEEYYVSENDYPLEEFPAYAYGSAYVTTGPTVVELFEATKDVQPFLPMDDIYITGLCGKYIDATLLHEPRFDPMDPPSPPSWQAYSNLATAHKVTPDVLELVWEDMAHDLLDHVLQQESAVNESVAQRMISISKKK